MFFLFCFLFCDSSFVQKLQGVPKFQNWVTSPKTRPLRSQLVVDTLKVPNPVSALYLSISISLIRYSLSYICACSITNHSGTYYTTRYCFTSNYVFSYHLPYPLSSILICCTNNNILVQLLTHYSSSTACYSEIYVLLYVEPLC